MNSRWGILVLCLLGCFQLPCKADMKPDMNDDYLKAQFDWAMYFDAQPVDHYLNYKGSRLHPLDRVRVYVRTFGASGKQTSEAPSQLYEEFWYFKGTPIGLRRRLQLKLETRGNGCLVLRSPGSAQSCRLAASNAIVRVSMALQLKQIPVSLVQVPETDFDSIAADLAHYGFLPHVSADEGEQMSIHLSSPDGHKDEYLFLQQ